MRIHRACHGCEDRISRWRPMVYFDAAPNDPMTPVLFFHTRCKLGYLQGRIDEQLASLTRGMTRVDGADPDDVDPFL